MVTERPATRANGVTQATRGCPSTQTVQQPHWPCGLHPSLTVWTPNRSRSASSSVSAVVDDLDGITVELEADGQEKLCPQPQLRVAFGFVMANPDWSRPSL